MRSKRTDNHTWRKIKSALASTTAFVSAILVILPLGLVFFHLLINGITSVNWDFFTKLPAPVGEVGGGMANAIVGSLELLALAGADWNSRWRPGRSLLRGIWLRTHQFSPAIFG
jgi:ABC-type phosphate transport system permease subunit